MATANATADELADAAAQAYIRQHQGRMPDWLLTYSPSRRSLIAYYRGYCPPPGIQVEAEYPDELPRLLHEAVQPLWQSHGAPTLAGRRPDPCSGNRAAPKG
ncbi:hypothetical protein HII36_05315 [Nonomuraea sp. NN258]|uniref:hypothetical protein n=1 Tax=Nonomuraea antri TaxID=2730852 RepID=UPI001568FA53|nr:hypothetical protein [Nonomuraea antri]NRQ31256.1 hypothetical protein [Nonomuraea antri]